MPYYRERFVNRETMSRTSTGTRPVVLDSADVTSFRTRPHGAALTSNEVSDVSADPYAYFLQSTSERSYAANLKARGMTATGSPDRGHTFSLRRFTLLGSLHDVDFNPAGAPDWGRQLIVFPQPSAVNQMNDVHNGNIVTPVSISAGGLDAFAQRAYAKVAPDSVVFDASVFLGELREGLPKLALATLESGARFYRGIGSDYLNVEFGWKPFISDIQNAAKALKRASKQLSSEGKRVHRKYSLPPIQRADTRTYTRSLSYFSGLPGLMAGQPGFPSSVIGGTTTRGIASYTKTATISRWFEGEFSSFFKLGFDPSDYYQRLDALVNTKITPETLWELSPWSWLVDWQLRIGDTIRANELAQNDRLIMHYGYAMQSEVYTTECSWLRDGKSVNWPTMGRLFSSTTFKTRIRANPYGFKPGLGAGGLSDWQLSILGALGLTRF